jgi:hypothetical protein
MNSQPTAEPALLSDSERLRLALLAVRQLAYGLADELGRLYDLERPCKRCERERRHGEPRPPPVR